jgi:WXXGXW repeat (2 copies)
MLRISKTLGAIALATALLVAPTASFAAVFVDVGIGVSVNIAPPALPIYVQPPCPAPNELWTPGYWAYGPYGYYWVPGTWVYAPQPGYLWTPGYWAFTGGAYGWHRGYWGPHVGFYGGVNYGFGYAGVGFVGGGWFGNQFRYNTAVTNVDTTVIDVHNTYVDRTVINNTTTFNHVSYNGGPGGIAARPTPDEAAASTEPHLRPTAEQRQHIQTAGQNRNSFASVNGGRPGTAAVAAPLSRANRPADFAPPSAQDRAPSAYRSERAPRSPRPEPQHDH